MHLDRMIYEAMRLSDAQRQEAIRDLVGDTKLDYAVGDSEDPLPIDTLNKQLDLRVPINPVVKGPGSCWSASTRPSHSMEHGRVTLDPSCKDLAWERENTAGS